MACASARSEPPPVAPDEPPPELRGAEDATRGPRLGAEVAVVVPPLAPVTLPPDPLEAAAMLRRQGDSAQAEELLLDWLGTAPPTAEAALGRALLGLMMVEQVRYAEADAVFEQGGFPQTLADLVAYRYGEVLRGLDRPADAARQFEAVVREPRSPLGPRAGFRLADAWFEAGDVKGALDQYRRMLDRYPGFPGAPGVRSRMAACLAALGRKDEAVELYTSVVRASPRSEAGCEAAAALRDLASQGVSRPAEDFDERLELGRTLRRQRRWPEALAVLEASEKEASSPREHSDAAMEVARTLEALDRYEDALSALDRARRAGAGGEAQRARVEVLRKLGRVEEAVALVRTMAGRGKAGDLAAARVYREDGVYVKARALLNRRVKPGRDPDANWLNAWLAYRTGHHAEAERGFTKLLKRGGGERPRLLYWIGRARMKRGAKAAAIEAFGRVAETDALGYYGLQAQSRLLDLGERERFGRLTGTPIDKVPEPAEAALTGARVRWDGADGVDAHESPEPPRSAQALREAVARYGEAFPELARALDRYRLGLDEEARIELRAARAELLRSHLGPARLLADLPASPYSDNRSAPRGLWGSSLSRRLGLPADVKRREEARLTAVRHAGDEADDALRALLIAVGDGYYRQKDAFAQSWRLLHGRPTRQTRDVFVRAFPLPFEATLRREARRYGQSPYLIGALAKVESAYNELAVSVAGACGLLQVMPVTGRLIADRRGDTEFGAGDLLHPEVSVAYGTWYLAELLKKFHGQEPLAIISYNAGPHRVQQWLAARGATSDLDEFIEEVPYDEARAYVKRVLRYVALYRRIYDDRADMYLGVTLDSHFESNINW